MSRKSGFYEIAQQAIMVPQEAAVLVKKPASSNSMRIGIPRETTFQENRIGLTPQATHLLIANGHEVIIEAGAGMEAKFHDSDYKTAGARITYNKEEVFKADIIMKVSFPTMDEIEMIEDGKTIISALHLSMLKEELIRLLIKKKVTAIAFEYLRDESNAFPVIQAMSEIAGSASILIAAEYLSNINHGKGVMLGGISGIPPSEVVILGAGTVGQFATRAALGLGAEVKVFDNSLYKLRRLQNDLSTRIYTSIMHPNILLKELRTADVAIGAIRADDGRTPCVVSEEMVMEMKYGSVIVDVSIDQGGCFETSEVTNHTDPIFEKHGVIHYCVPNIASRVARTASYALSNIFAPILLDIGDYGGIKNYLWDKEGVRFGVYIYKGNLTNKHIGERFHLPNKDIGLLIAAHI
jgi:alanine dehydrogenase